MTQFSAIGNIFTEILKFQQLLEFESTTPLIYLQVLNWLQLDRKYGRSQ